MTGPYSRSRCGRCGGSRTKAWPAGGAAAGPKFGQKQAGVFPKWQFGSMGEERSFRAECCDAPG